MRSRTGRDPTCGSGASTGPSSRSSAASRPAPRSSSSSSQNPTTRWVGLGWLALGTVGYAVYRRRWVKASVLETVKAPPAFGAALALEYRRILVPIVPGPGLGRRARRRLQPRDRARGGGGRADRARGPARPAACRRPRGSREAGEPGARPGDRRSATRYGVRVRPAPRPGTRARARRSSRRPGASRPRSSCSARPRRRLTMQQAALFGRTVDYVLRHAPCRVMIASSPDVRGAIARGRRPESPRPGGRGLMARKVRGFERQPRPGEPSSGSRTGRSAPRSTSRSGSSPRRRSGSPRQCSSRAACSSSSSRSPTPRGRPRSRRAAAPRRSSRRAFGDLAGFVTGWALFLDYVIVMALSALFLPALPRRRPLGAGPARAAVGHRARPSACSSGSRSSGSSATRGRTSARSRSPCLDLAVQALVVVLGLAVLFSGSELADGFSFAERAGLADLAFALPLALLAFTGLETVSNLAVEAREPGRSVPRSTLSAGAARRRHDGARRPRSAITALPVEDGRDGARDDVARGAARGHRHGLRRAPARRRSSTCLRIVVGISGALILLSAATTSVSGVTRLAFSMARHGMLPRELGRIERRTLVSNEAILLVGGAAVAAVLAAGLLGGRRPPLPRERVLVRGPPRLHRGPARRDPAPGQRARAGARLPGAPRGHACVGTGCRCRRSSARRSTLAVLVLAMVTHEGARTSAPPGSALGLVVFVTVRARERRSLRRRVERGALPPTAVVDRVLVPMKLGDIGEEMVATAIALAKEREAEIEALYVVRVPRVPAARRAAARPRSPRRRQASLAEAEALGEDHGVVVRTEVVRARSIGHAIVDEATGGRRTCRHGLLAAVAAAVALLLPDRRARAPPRTVPGGRRRLPGRRVRR